MRTLNKRALCLLALMSLTREADALLGGRVRLRQSEGGYRAAIDSVLLGASVQAGAGRAVELGCGAGAALLTAAYHNADARFVGLENAQEAFALVNVNITENGLSERVEARNVDATNPPADLRESADAVFLNPPFYDDPSAIRVPKNPERAAAFLAEDGGLKAWVRAAFGCARGRGRVTVIHRADRLVDLLQHLSVEGGDVRVLPIHPRPDAPAKRVLVSARKNVRTPLTILPPLHLHALDGGWTTRARSLLEGERPLALEA